MNDGGPVFPTEKWATDNQGHWIGTHGLSIRDYFAAKAMQGYLFNDVVARNNPNMCAEWAYQQADAMLKERENHRKGV